MNFHRKYNVSKVAILHNNGYLPPAAVPDFSLPEVIDNRARNAVAATNETRNYPNMLYLLERDSWRKGTQDVRHSGSGLQTSQHHRRPIFSEAKHSRQTTMQPPPLLAEMLTSSFTDRINVEEMSCQNAVDELFFR